MIYIAPRSLYFPSKESLSLSGAIRANEFSAKILELLVVNYFIRLYPAFKKNLNEKHWTYVRFSCSLCRSKAILFCHLWISSNDWPWHLPSIGRNLVKECAMRKIARADLKIQSERRKKSLNHRHFYREKLISRVTVTFFSILRETIWTMFFFNKDARNTKEEKNR